MAFRIRIYAYNMMWLAQVVRLRPETVHVVFRRSATTRAWISTPWATPRP